MPKQTPQIPRRNSQKPRRHSATSRSRASRASRAQRMLQLALTQQGSQNRHPSRRVLDTIKSTLFKVGSPSSPKKTLTTRKRTPERRSTWF